MEDRPCIARDDDPLPPDVLDGCRVMGECRPEYHYLYRPNQFVVRREDLPEVLPRLRRLAAERERRHRWCRPFRRTWRPLGVAHLTLVTVRVDLPVPYVVTESLRGLRVAPHHVFPAASHIRVTPDGPPRENNGPMAALGSAASETSTRRVAVLDTGYNHSDPFFTGRCTGTPESPTPINGVLPYRAGHGTFVAGIILEREPRARIRMLGVMDPASGVVDDATLTAALRGLQQDTGANRVDVINLSAAGTVFKKEMVATVQQIQTMVAQRPDLVVVAAAGNDGSNAQAYPGAMPEVVGVAAVVTKDQRACFSNYGSWVDASAVGVDQVSRYFTYQGFLELPAPHPACGTGTPGTGVRSFNGTAIWNGSSFAAPVVTASVVTRLLAGQTGAAIRASFTPAANGLGTFVP